MTYEQWKTEHLPAILGAWDRLEASRESMHAEDEAQMDYYCEIAAAVTQWEGKEHDVTVERLWNEAPEAARLHALYSEWRTVEGVATDPFRGGDVDASDSYEAQRELLALTLTYWTNGEGAV
jgi:hypothetical protein